MAQDPLCQSDHCGCNGEEALTFCVNGCREGVFAIALPPSRSPARARAGSVANQKCWRSGTIGTLSLPQSDEIKRAQKGYAEEHIMKLLTRIFAIFVSATAAVSPVSAKRLAPRPVTPVIVNSVEYSAPVDFVGVVVATDVSSREVLWKKRIYRIRYLPFLETDVQDVYISSLSIEGNALIVANERGCQFALDLATQAVTEIKACPSK